MQLSGNAGEGLGAEKAERLIAGDGRVGVDGSEVDVIVVVLEIGDDIACRGGLAGLVDGVEIEAVGAESAGQDIATETAVEDIGIIESEQLVVAATAEQLVLAAAALG
ncbi:MAG: hypothetical protein R3D57_08975 [Hyphomicrobiaceae bacterium]